MSTKLIGRKMPKTFTRSVLCAVCLMAIQGNTHASKTNILVTKKGDAIFRIADTSGVTLTLSSGDKTGDITRSDSFA